MAWKGLVIDVRLNGGGADPYGIAIARRLTSTPYTAYVKQARSDPADATKWTAEQPSVVQPSTRPSFLGPVVELTGIQSVSAAETFTQALMNRTPKIDSRRARRRRASSQTYWAARCLTVGSSGWRTSDS